MSSARTRLRFPIIELVASGFLAGCAWDNSPPPYHSVITYDPSRAQTYVSTGPTTNMPSTGNWIRDSEVGVYGFSGAYTAPTPQTVGGAVSSPSGVSYGGAAGTASPAPASTVNTSPAINPPQPAIEFNPTISSPGSTLQYPSPTGFTNTTTGVLFTNQYTAPTNTLPNPTLNLPRP